MQSKTKFSIWNVIVIVVFMFFLQTFVLPPKEDHLPYSQFEELIQKDQVAEVVIGPQFIEGKYKAGDAVDGKAKIFKTVRVGDPDLVKKLTEHAVTFSGQYQNSFLKGLLGWILPLVIFFGIWALVMKKMGPGAGVMSFGKSQARLIAQENLTVGFDDVAGVDEAKEELKEVIDYLKTPQRFQALGAQIPKGVLLVGPPGTGKTLLAQAVAGEAGVPFFSMSGSDFVEMFVGVGASRVRDLFVQAHQKAPCIIFIDELDALGKARSAGGPMGGNDEREQTLNQLLAEMDGFDAKQGVIIMAATNRPEILDPALLRPGRFDRHVLVDRPDRLGREAILKIHAKKIKLAADVNLKTLAARTPGMAGADLANVVNEAALLAARRNKSAADRSDFEEAIDRIVAGLEKKQRVMSKEEKERVAYHELGHAITAESLPHTDPVHKVSIIPRGISALGYTEQLPTEDRYLMTKSELLDRLAVLFGGRAAEDLVFNESSTGAQNDLEKASDMARRMITEYGMSDRQGPVSFEKERRPLFIETGYSPPKTYSAETAREIDEEVKALINTAYEKAKSILVARREVLTQIAGILLEKEVLDGEELRRLLKKDEEAK